MGTVKVKPIPTFHYKDALGQSQKICGHASYFCHIPTVALVTVTYPPKPQFPCLWNWSVQQVWITGFFTMLFQRKEALLFCLHPTPHPHQSLLVTFLEFCNPSLSSLLLEILLVAFWQKLLLPVCDTMTHFMQLYYNRTGRWNWKLTHFWRTCCVPGTVQRIFTRSQLILKTTFKGGDDISITQVRKVPLVVKVIELGITQAHTRAHFRWCWGLYSSCKVVLTVLLYFTLYYILPLCFFSEDSIYVAFFLTV